MRVYGGHMQVTVSTYENGTGIFVVAKLGEVICMWTAGHQKWNVLRKMSTVKCIMEIYVNGDIYVYKDLSCCSVNYGMHSYVSYIFWCTLQLRQENCSRCGNLTWANIFALKTY